MAITAQRSFGSQIPERFPVNSLPSAAFPSVYGVVG